MKWGDCFPTWWYQLTFASRTSFNLHPPASFLVKLSIFLYVRFLPRGLYSLNLCPFSSVGVESIFHIDLWEFFVKPENWLALQDLSAGPELVFARVYGALWCTEVFLNAVKCFKHQSLSCLRNSHLHQGYGSTLLCFLNNCMFCFSHLGFSPPGIICVWCMKRI